MPRVLKYLRALAGINGSLGSADAKSELRSFEAFTRSTLFAVSSITLSFIL